MDADDRELDPPAPPAPRRRKLQHHQTVAVPTLGGLVVYTTALDEQGDLWERWSNDAPGVWHKVPGPVG